MSIGSIAAELTADLHSLVDSDTVRRKILAAMRHHRERRQWFSERTFTFNLQAGKASYSPGDGLPPDLVEVVGNELWVLVGGSEDQRQVCLRVTSGELETYKQDGTGQTQPEVWDFWANQLRVYPIPSDSSDVLTGRYVRDIGVPQARYENSAWAYYDPAGLKKLTSAEVDAWANDWTDPQGAYHLVRSRAMYLICSESLRDAEMAERAMTAWLEQLSILEAETEAKTAGATEVRPWMLD